MLTKLIIRNFKQFNEVEIELGNTVVFVGPNNSGKTTALQALSLWYTGLQQWLFKKGGRNLKERTGTALGRRDLIAIPVPKTRLLWRDLSVRKGSNENVRIDIIVEGVTLGKSWKCGMQFDYSNEESIVCRPLIENNGNSLIIPEEAKQVSISLLPPMSGLAAIEPKLEPGRIDVLIGEGQTAQVLRNMCYRVFEANEQTGNWDKLKAQIEHLFGVSLSDPEFIQSRGEITMEYETRNHIRLDLSSTGRGLQQTLLLLAHLYSNEGAVLLLDEPDAHLEILRQQQIYQNLTTTAQSQKSQIIVASHSEVLLNEAAGKDMVIAFVGKPHRIDNRKAQVLKALKDISFEDYYKTELKGWILYLEGSTDANILKALAKKINHPVNEYLEQAFFHYINSNDAQRARDHFYGLREAREDLIGILILDNTDKNLTDSNILVELMWAKREIENYLAYPETLINYVTRDLPDDLFGMQQRETVKELMQRLIEDLIPPVAMRDRTNDWWNRTKMSDDFLDPLFKTYYQELGLPNLMLKTNYHILADYLTPEQIHPEIIEKLDAIYEVAKRAKPRE